MNIHNTLKFIPEYIFCFDVESVGLYGPAFSVGGGVFNTITGECFYLFRYTTDYKKYDLNSIDPSSLEWVKNNIPFLEITHNSIESLRHDFVRFWRELKIKYPDMIMMADCPFPVETNFLKECFEHENDKMSLSPYPLIDVSSILLSAGVNPLETFTRKEYELPAHDPLNDAKQSFRIFIENIAMVRMALELYKDTINKYESR